MFTYSSLQPAYCLLPASLYFLLIFSLEGSSQQQIGGGPVLKEVICIIVCRVDINSSLAREESSSMHFTRSAGLLKTKIPLILKNNEAKA